MRLVFWNCNMALHAKLPLLAWLQPAIAVLPECARPDIVRSKAGLFVPESFIWIGDNPHKGLGVVAFGAYRVELASNHDASFRYVAPCHVAGPVAFNLIGLWDYHVGAEKMGRMPGPFRRALDHWQDYLRSAPTIIGGDFNNHVVFDKPVHEGNFAELDAHMRRLGFFSAYNAHHGVGLGAATEPTHHCTTSITSTCPRPCDMRCSTTRWEPSTRGYDTATICR